MRYLYKLIKKGGRPSGDPLDMFQRGGQEKNKTLTCKINHEEKKRRDDEGLLSVSTHPHDSRSRNRDRSSIL